ncbi:cysteine synthase [Eremomyces bilateralis CBS 781.70]|uniref:Cysteine synthase 2 n=1 Tax=Eremomyces bilateralis CBS 781.70 TaxID=1392243 RepID=A0A6G1FY49_9PEZI|nr:cysteine synthase [Eremomyces bilateralis CBS 781.70]KAF1810688.1 cysteine synthase [Eremomyces bilateralis CBS 781.70]
MQTKYQLYIGASVLAGVLLTLGFKDVYPDLERRYRQRKRRASVVRDAPTPSAKRRLSLRDNTSRSRSLAPGGPIPEGVEGLIGNTPLFKIKSLSDETGCEILAKAEFLNGAGNSPKDRVALSIIQIAEEDGLISPDSGDTIYEGTVGSTGISLAAICRAKGYLAHICMPDDQAEEKYSLLLKLGAVVDKVRPAPIVDPNHFVNRARSLAEAHTNDPEKRGRGIFADQFETDANWMAHFNGTGPEIYEQTTGRLDAFVTGAGTGGTISGVARYLKPRIERLKVVLADPQGSGLYNRIKFGVMFDPKEREGTRRRHQVDTIVEGIGINRVTRNLEAGRQLIDDAVRVTDAQASAMGRWLVEKDGLFVGSSSAVNCVAATKVARQLGPGHTIVTILCDSGTRHLSKFWAKAGDIGGSNEMTLDAVLTASDS